MNINLQNNNKLKPKLIMNLLRLDITAFIINKFVIVGAFALIILISYLIIIGLNHHGQ